MGQGTLTGLAQLVAEELDWTSIELDHAARQQTQHTQAGAEGPIVRAASGLAQGAPALRAAAALTRLARWARGLSCGRHDVPADRAVDPRCIVRREFITLLGDALASPILARAQQPTKLPRVGVLTPATTDATPIFDGFRRGLRDLGYIEGTTIILDFARRKTWMHCPRSQKTW
jgi:hypothetical protein